LIDCELEAISGRKALLGVAAGQRAEKSDLDGVLGLRSPASEGEPGGNERDAGQAYQPKKV
jgi:hypothetical protein